MAVVNGWTIRAHPLLFDQLEKLTDAVEAQRRKDPTGYRTSANAKLLAALRTLMFEKIPADPASPAYLQGNTLGPDHRHWFRAKFGVGRFRLFFRYSSRARVIIYAWVNDETTLRSYGARSDAYAVFRQMLAGGNPPDDWDNLVRLASDAAALERFGQTRPSVPGEEL